MSYSRSSIAVLTLFSHRIPDLVLSPKHPKRVFMHRSVDHEIRLAYHDRILRTLPEPMQAPDALLLPAEAPGPDFEYDDPGILSSSTLPSMR